MILIIKISSQRKKQKTVFTTMPHPYEIHIVFKITNSVLFVLLLNFHLPSLKKASFLYFLWSTSIVSRANQFCTCEYFSIKPKGPATFHIIFSRSVVEFRRRRMKSSILALALILAFFAIKVESCVVVVTCNVAQATCASPCFQCGVCKEKCCRK